MKIAIGLVVKGGKQFIDQWKECAERIADVIFVIDNGADNEVKQKLINFSKVKQYLIQKDMGRNQSRDYQKILDMAREENCDWVWNLDIDEYVPKFDVNQLLFHLINTKDNSVGFALFEMRNDNEHYIMIELPGLKPSHARTCHKLYKVLSHFEFNINDYHGCSIPHNCAPGITIKLPIQHYGHLTKELRKEKKKCYTKDVEDKEELLGSWMKEDKDVVIKKWGDFSK